MPRIADALERESRTVDLEQGDFERLLGRRERKQRNRRIRAGALGVIVALAIGTVLVRSLTSDPIPVDPPVEPRPAPAASGTLAYVLDGDVYVADPDGSNAVKIANGISLRRLCLHRRVLVLGRGSDVVAGRAVPRLSPRGLFQRGPGTTNENWGDVVISDAAGNVLATFPADGWDIGWSPDSTRVAVWDTFVRDGRCLRGRRRPAGADHDAVRMATGRRSRPGVAAGRDVGGRRRGAPARRSRGGVGSTRHEQPSGERITSPRVGFRADSPDGSHTAYVKGRSLTVEDSDGSGSVTLLTVERGTSLGVIGFSPEGDRILFSKDERAGVAREWSCGASGSTAPTPASSSPGRWQGEWFVPSDVGRIRRTAMPGRLRQASGALAYVLDGDIYVADPDGSNAVKIANGLPEEDCAGIGEYWAEGPMWSPDGRYLAYRYSDCSDPEAVGRDVVISDAEGNVLATFPAQGWDIAWSPDSTRVAVWDRSTTRPSTIGVYGLDGARQTQLTMPSGWTTIRR